MSAERIVATYLVETPLAISQAADVLAGEQSSGTFVAVPGGTDELRHRFGARVERVTELESVDTPSLPMKTGSSPSPGTPGEGRGEGLRFGISNSKSQSPHPGPLPDYRARGPEENRQSGHERF